MAVRVVVTNQGEAVEAKYAVGAPEETDDSALGTMMHSVCGGEIRRQPITRELHALFCQQCGLRVVIPDYARTWRELRRHFRHFNLV